MFYALFGRLLLFSSTDSGIVYIRHHRICGKALTLFGRYCNGKQEKPALLCRNDVCGILPHAGNMRCYHGVRRSDGNHIKIRAYSMLVGVFSGIDDMGKKLLPDTSRKGFIRSLFRDRLELKWLVISALIPAVMFAVTVFALSFIYKRPLNELFKTEFAAYPALFITNIISGPMAEEPGWRGYYLVNSEKMRGQLKGTLTTGLFWGLWHAPLWFMEGYTPVNLIVYIFAFMIAIMSFNVLLSYIFSSRRNILYCVVMHQMFNFLGQLLNIQTDEFIVYMILCAVFYFVAAVITVIVSKKRSQTMTPSSL